MSILVPYSRSRISSLCLALWGQEKGGIIDSSRDTPTSVHFTVHNFLMLMAKYLLLHYLWSVDSYYQLVQVRYQHFLSLNFPFRAVEYLYSCVNFINRIYLRCPIYRNQILSVWQHFWDPNHSLQFLSDIDSKVISWLLHIWILLQIQCTFNQCQTKSHPIRADHEYPSLIYCNFTMQFYEILFFAGRE